MTPWSNENWPLVNIGKHKFFRDKFETPLSNNSTSVVMFAGSCDLSGVRHGKYWHELLCETLEIEPLTAAYLGTPICTFPSLLRRLYVQLKNTNNSPKRLFLVAPVSTQEHLIDGTCYSINTRQRPMEFLYRTGLIPPTAISQASALQRAYELNNGFNQRVYSFQRDFSFLEMICRAYSIDLRWTPNRTKNASLFYTDVSKMLEDHEFARKTCVGFDVEYDFDTTHDAPTSASQQRIAELFTLSFKSNPECQPL